MLKVKACSATSRSSANSALAPTLTKPTGEHPASWSVAGTSTERSVPRGAGLQLLCLCTHTDLSADTTNCIQLQRLQTFDLFQVTNLMAHDSGVRSQQAYCTAVYRE